MLGKLLKHEFRATRRVMLPLMALVLLLSVFAGFASRGLEDMSGINDIQFMRTLYFIILFSFFLSLFAVCVVTFVLMIQRFYLSLLHDEGYLSLTLPVSVDEHILSRLIVSVVWFAAVALLCMTTLLVVLSIGAPEFTGFGEMLRDLPELLKMDEVPQILGGGLVVAFAGACALCLQCYCAMAAGCSADDHKLLLSFVSYFLLGFATTIINSNLFAVSGALLNSDEGFHLYLWLIALIQAVYAAIFYFAARWFLKNKLNLA